MTRKPSRKPFSSLFIQTRVGRDGKPLQVTKLRTMRMDAPPAVEIPNSHEVLYTPKDARNRNPHVIPSKRWLRRFWIDELPQVVLLFRKDLRLFGPRATFKEAFTQLPDWKREMYTRYSPALIPLEVAVSKKAVNDAQLRIEYNEFFAQWKQKPAWTNFKYFIRFMRNVLSGRVRGA